MCIAIYKPAGVRLSKDIYQECFDNNPDGGGFAYVKDGKLTIDKGFFKLDDMVSAIEAEHEREMIIHFRVASHGEICADNCHPFAFNSELFPRFSFALIHNGILKWRSSKEKSDTRCFIEDIIQPHLNRDPFFLDTVPGMVMLKETIGCGNKMVIIRYDSDTNSTAHYIINEEAGNTSEKCWFSNTSWKKSRYVAQQTSFLDGNDWGGWHLDADRGWVNRRLLNEQLVNLPQDINLNIQVPRDENVDCGDLDLLAFSKQERKAIRKQANRYVLEVAGSTKGWTQNEIVKWMINDLREFVSDLKQKTDNEVIKWVIDNSDEKYSNGLEVISAES